MVVIDGFLPYGEGGDADIPQEEGHDAVDEEIRASTVGPRAEQSSVPRASIPDVAELAPEPTIAIGSSTAGLGFFTNCETDSAENPPADRAECPHQPEEKPKPSLLDKKALDETAEHFGVTLTADDKTELERLHSEARQRAENSTKLYHYVDNGLSIKLWREGKHASIDFTPDNNTEAPDEDDKATRNKYALNLIRASQNFCLLVESGQLERPGTFASPTNPEMAAYAVRHYGCEEKPWAMEEGQVRVSGTYEGTLQHVFSAETEAAKVKLTERLQQASENQPEVPGPQPTVTAGVGALALTEITQEEDSPEEDNVGPEATPPEDNTETPDNPENPTPGQPEEADEAEEERRRERYNGKLRNARDEVAARLSEIGTRLVEDPNAIRKELETELKANDVNLDEVPPLDMNKLERYTILAHLIEKQMDFLVEGEGNEARFKNPPPLPEEGRTPFRESDAHNAVMHMMSESLKHLQESYAPWWKAVDKRYEALGDEMIQEGDWGREVLFETFNLSLALQSSNFPRSFIQYGQYIREHISETGHVQAAHDLIYLVGIRASLGLARLQQTETLDTLDLDIEYNERANRYVARRGEGDNWDNVFVKFEDIENIDMRMATLKCPAHTAPTAKAEQRASGERRQTETLLIRGGHAMINLLKDYKLLGVRPSLIV